MRAVGFLKGFIVGIKALLVENIFRHKIARHIFTDQAIGQPRVMVLWRGANNLEPQIMIDLVDTLATQTGNYDIILMDGPPLLATTEAAALAPLADEVIIVVGTGDTTLDESGSSLDFLGGVDHVSLLMNRIYFQEAKTSNYPYGEVA